MPSATDPGIYKLLLCVLEAELSHAAKPLRLQKPQLGWGVVCRGSIHVAAAD